MIDVFLIYTGIQGIAHLRGRKSPLYGALGIIIHLTLGAFLPQANNSDWLSYLAVAAVSSIICIGIVGVILFLIPKANIRDGATPSKIPYLLVSLVLVGLGMLVMYSNANSPSGQGGGGYAVFMIFGAAYTAFRYHQRNKASKELISDLDAPILWLRSFDLDNIKKAPFLLPSVFTEAAGNNFEELISRGFKKFSPFIALGNPTDFLPEPGAKKIYSTDSDWQNTVIKYIIKSRAIVIVEGNSPGLAWELKTVRSIAPIEKIFLLTPPKKFRKPQWGEFRALLQASGFHNIPQDPGPGTVINFINQHQSFFLVKESSSPEDMAKAINDRLSDFN